MNGRRTGSLPVWHFDPTLRKSVVGQAACLSSFPRSRDLIPLRAVGFVLLEGQASCLSYGSSCEQGVEVPVIRCPFRKREGAAFVHLFSGL
jgi:hypothetical protein